MAGLHNQVTNRPTLVVHDKINDVAHRSFAGLDGVAAKSLCALQMTIRIRSRILQPTERKTIGNQINAARIFARENLVSVASVGGDYGLERLFTFRLPE
jgi:hypothetical protein